MTFPVEPVPDGDPWAPHHLYIGLLITGFGFAITWANYPKLGSTMTLLGIAIQTDDAISHTFGVWTPLDWFWNEYLMYWVTSR